MKISNKFRRWLISVACMSIGLALSGCTMRLSSDGTESYTLDGEQAAKAVVIFEENLH